MEDIAIGLDIAKRVFQARGADATGQAMLRRKLQRPEVLAFFKGLLPCPVGNCPLECPGQPLDKVNLSCAAQQFMPLSLAVQQRCSCIHDGERQ